MISFRSKVQRSYDNRTPKVVHIYKQFKESQPLERDNYCLCSVMRYF